MWETWLGVVAVGILVIVLGVLALAWRSRRTGGGLLVGPRRPARDHFRRGSAAAPRRRVTIVLNPTKVDDLTTVRAALTRRALALGWAEPEIVETTIEDPGSGQARAALHSGADLVCALGGDGTVRAVAEVLAGTHTPMGLLANGTGNLLARNLQLPVDNLDQALEVALTGLNRHIDIGWVSVDPTDEQLTVPAEAEQPSAEDEEPATEDEEPATEDEESAAEGLEPTAEDEAVAPNRHAFLVMAGLGLDAAIMEGTSEQLKAKVGWPAYLATGARTFLRARFRTRLVVDDGEEIAVRARTIVVGNCGRLTGGITLMPDAEVDDGILDLVAITPKGIAGWAGVAAHLLSQRQKEHSRVDRYRCRRALVTVEDAQRVQLDGDVIGEANRVLFSIQPRSLIVRVATIPPRAPAPAE